MNAYKDAARAAKVAALCDTWTALPMFAGDLDLAAEIAETVADDVWAAVAVLAKVRQPSATTIAAVRLRLRNMARAAAEPVDAFAGWGA